MIAETQGLLKAHLGRMSALPAHGNRTLHQHQLFQALLCCFYNPLIRSLRLIEDSGDFGGQVDLPRLARSTTSDALAACDPKLLEPLIADLLQRCPSLAAQDQSLEVLRRRIIAADGTYLTTLCNVAWALHHTKSNGQVQGQVRANVQMDVRGWTPQVISISGDDGQGEPAAFAADLLCGVLYVLDRNFCDFGFLKQLLDRDNQMVLRVREHIPAVRVLSERALSEADRAAGIRSDQEVELTGHGAPAGRFRLTILTTVNRSGKTEIIRLLSNLLSPEIAAHIVSDLYRLRWQIELFFKWLKVFARMDHLLSTSRNGMSFQFYVALIAVLLMHVQSGHRVSIYSLAALGQVANGQMSIEQALQVIARRERERERERQRQARRRAQKKRP